MDESGPLKVASSREISAIFVFGVVYITAIMIVAFVFPNPTPFQYLVVRVVLALSAAAIATLLTGFINLEIPKFIKAGGALAVFVIVFFYNPASLVVASSEGSVNGTITLGNQK
jgi:hypothetical protein